MASQCKNQFPKEYQEIVKFDEVTGEKHIADIFIPHADLTIEIQHSPITPEEIRSREDFYKRKSKEKKQQRMFIDNKTLHQFGN